MYIKVYYTFAYLLCKQISNNLIYKYLIFTCVYILTLHNLLLYITQVEVKLFKTYGLRYGFPKGLQ